MKPELYPNHTIAALFLAGRLNHRVVWCLLLPQYQNSDDSVLFVMQNCWYVYGSGNK